MNPKEMNPKSEFDLGFNEAESLICNWVFNKGLREALVRARQEATDTQAHIAQTEAKPENRAYNEGRLSAMSEFVSRHSGIKQPA